MRDREERNSALREELREAIRSCVFNQDDIDADFLTEQLAVADEAYAAFELRAALAAYRKVEVNGATLSSLSDLADFLNEAGFSRAGIAVRRFLAERDERDILDVLAYIQTLRIHGQLEKALKCCELALGIWRGHPRLYASYIELCTRIGEEDRADTAESNLVAMRPSDSPDATGLASVLFELGHFEAAQATAAYALTVDPNDAAAAYVFHQTRRVDWRQQSIRHARKETAKKWAMRMEAVDTALEKAKRGPDNSQAWLDVGEAWGAMHCTGASLAAYRRALRADPNCLKAHQKLSDIYTWRGSTELVVGEIHAILDAGHQDEDGSLHQALGNESMLAGRPAKAIEHWRIALDRQPDNWQLRFQMIRELCRQGRDEEAWDLVQAARGNGTLPRRELETIRRLREKFEPKDGADGTGSPEG